MLLSPKFTASMPYGSYELKRIYQYNMAAAIIITGLAVGTIWGGFWIYKKATYVDIEEIPTIMIESVMDLGPPPSIVQKPPQIEIAKPKLAQPKVGIPKPVEDDELIDEEVVLATKEELAEINVSDLDLGGDDGVKIEIQQDILPGQNDFVKVEVQPAFIYKETPVYPPLAQRASMEGTVWVKILVDKNGNALQAVVAKASGANAGFEEAAVEAAKKCKFSPAIQNGRPIALWVTFPFKFELSR